MIETVGLQTRVKPMTSGLTACYTVVTEVGAPKAAVVAAMCLTTVLSVNNRHDIICVNNKYIWGYLSIDNTEALTLPFWTRKSDKECAGVGPHKQLRPTISLAIKRLNASLSE